MKLIQCSCRPLPLTEVVVNIRNYCVMEVAVKLYMHTNVKAILCVEMTGTIIMFGCSPEALRFAGTSQKLLTLPAGL